MIDLDINPDCKKLRSFAWVSTFVFAVVAFMLHRDESGKWIQIVAASFACYSFFCAMISPGLVRPLYVILTVLAFPIGWISSNIILMLLYYGMILPVGVLLRFFGKDPVDKRFKDGAISSWVPKKQDLDRKRYYNQY